MKKILIVEDNPGYISELAERLTREGFEVLQARDGEEGLQMAIDNHPDLMTVDIKLPKFDGMVLMNKVRHHDPWGERVPIVLLTNVTPDDRVIKEVAEDSPSYYLLKSESTLDDISGKVKEILGISSAGTIPSS